MNLPLDEGVFSSVPFCLLTQADVRLNGFGHVHVVQCKDLGSDKKLAVKIVYQYSSRLKESAILKEFTELDEDKNNQIWGPFRHEEGLLPGL